jgi:large subunit ribosomal protein L4
MAEKKKTAAKAKADAPAAKAPRARAEAKKPAAKKPAAKKPAPKRRDISEDDTAQFVREKSGAVRPAGGATVPVVDAGNNRLRDVALRPEVFAVETNTHLLWEAVKEYRAGGRRGTHMTKNRALVSGSGKKPWRQKGTGRARVGETRNPLWRHGGTVFGPQPRDYSYPMPKKARTQALRSALSQRANEGAIVVVEAFPIDVPKTKTLKGILDKLGVSGKALLVEHQPTDALVLSGRNIPNLKVVADTHLTAYDVLDCRHLLVSQEALDKLEERLAP